LFITVCIEKQCTLPLKLSDYFPNTNQTPLRGCEHYGIHSISKLIILCKDTMHTEICILLRHKYFNPMEDIVLTR